MGEVTAIPWCHHTFNGWIGCMKISPGCTNCYAAVDTAARVSRAQGLELWGINAARRITTRDYWKKPLRWNRDAAAAGERRRVFTASLSDVFEDRTGNVHDHKGNVLWVNGDGEIISGGETTPQLSRKERTATLDDVRERLRWTIFQTTNLDWLVLTKRPEFAREWIAGHLWPTENVWLGVSVEDRKHGLPRIDVLRSIPARVRFLSVEPLLEDIGPIDLTGIHWVIVGGESGPKARPFNLAWAQSIVGQCKAAGVACFVKQLGAYAVDNVSDASGWRADRLGEWPAETRISQRLPGEPWHRIHLIDHAGADPSEWPCDLRVREFPC